MDRTFKMGKSFIIFVIILPLMTILSIVIYNEYVKTKENIFDIIQEHLVNEKLTLLKNFSDYLTIKLGANIQSEMANNKELQNHYEEELCLLQGNEIKYLYLLYKDKDNKFRYLLDATTNSDERAEFNQKFDPQTDIWNQAYKTKRLQITKQNDLQTLWITIAYPLVADNKVVAVLGADFTYDVYEKIVNTLKPMEKVYFYVAIFMAIMLIVAYILIYLYYINRKKSFIDPLTKTYNRQYLTELLETTSLQDFQLMMIDLDHFKLINDNFGHNVGDKVLVSVVQEIKSNIRQKDILIRFGGEEFLLLIYKQELKDCIIVAQRIRVAMMNRVIKAQNHQITITLSIGINPFPYFAKNIEEAIKIADEQLYKAKTSGRNCIRVFKEKDKHQSQTSKRISDVQLAIDENRILCAFQPIFSTKDRKLCKYEMLLRLIDTENYIVPPNDFLPSIKHTQVYINLTRIILNIALKTLKENQFELTLNLDLQDILNDDIMNMFKDRFMNERALAERLCIEILEHEEITNFELIQARINMLKELGFKIALDDFGSGYANFRYLIHLHIDILKIDGTLIRNINEDEFAYNIVQTIIEFADRMGIETVAEQIETEVELQAVEELGVSYLQGYHLGRPSFDF